jgi:cobalt-zinc-cadmium efflux system outer membrane protein
LQITNSTTTRPRNVLSKNVQGKFKVRRLSSVILLIVQIVITSITGAAQNSSLQASVTEQSIASSQRRDKEKNSSSLYTDPITGVTADEAVTYALLHNGELLAMRGEIGVAESLVKQAALRSNPRVDASISQNVTGTDNNITLNGMLPLELGGRRSTRISVAERRVEVRRQSLADSERQVAAEVRSKFGETLARILKLAFDEELLAASQRSYRLVAARVTEGSTAPLEENMVLVEVNRLRSSRETSEGKLEVSMLELRNLMGKPPEEPLRLRGDFESLIGPMPAVAYATERALKSRPDLLVARATESLADAQIEHARATGRLDASLTAGYQRMKFGFGLSGINTSGQLQPIQGDFNYLTIGVSLDVPVRNKNQGAIEAAVAEAEVAKKRREFAELTIRREVAAAFVKYERAARSMEIYRAGVRDQANSNLNVVRQTYELGARTLIDYIGEQRRFIEIENNYIDALLETYQARVEILRVTSAPELTKK